MTMAMYKTTKQDYIQQKKYTQNRKSLKHPVFSFYQDIKRCSVVTGTRLLSDWMQFVLDLEIINRLEMSYSARPLLLSSFF